MLGATCLGLISGCLGLVIYLIGVIKSKAKKEETPERKEEE